MEVMDAARWQPATVARCSAARARGGCSAGWLAAHGPLTLVQPQVYAGAHGCLLHALAQLGAARGVAAVSPWDSRRSRPASLPVTVCAALRAVCHRCTMRAAFWHHIAVLHRLLPRCWHYSSGHQPGLPRRISTGPGPAGPGVCATPGVLSRRHRLRAPGAAVALVGWPHLYLKRCSRPAFPPESSAAAALLDFALDAADRVLLAAGSWRTRPAGCVPEPWHTGHQCPRFYAASRAAVSWRTFQHRPCQ